MKTASHVRLGAAAALAAFCLSPHAAHASLARVAVLGAQPIFQPANTMMDSTALNPIAVPGVLWAEDDWNIFLNPALINNYRTRIQANASRDSLVHGGAFYGIETFVFGAYFNRRDDLSLMQPGAAYKPFGNVGGLSADIGPRLPVEVFAAGEWGVKWGVKLAWANHTEHARRGFGQSAAKLTARHWRVDGGVEFFGMEAFAGGTIFSEYEDGSQLATKQVIDQVHGGLRGLYEGFRPYVMYNQQRESIASSRFATSVGASTRVWGIGVGRDWNPIEDLKVYHNLGVWFADLEDTTGPYDRSDWQQLVVPLDVAGEYDFTDWFTLRAGLSYDAFNHLWKKTGTAAVSGDRTDSLRDILRPRVGAAVKMSGFEGELAVGRGANTHAVNIDAHRPDDRVFGFDPGWFMALSASYSP